jgi:hypothetical protein
MNESPMNNSFGAHCAEFGTRMRRMPSAFHSVWLGRNV